MPARYVFAVLVLTWPASAEASPLMWALGQVWYQSPVNTICVEDIVNAPVLSLNASVSCSKTFPDGDGSSTVLQATAEASATLGLAGVYGSVESDSYGTTLAHLTTFARAASIDFWTLPASADSPILLSVGWQMTGTFLSDGNAQVLFQNVSGSGSIGLFPDAVSVSCNLTLSIATCGLTVIVTDENPVRITTGIFMSATYQGSTLDAPFFAATDFLHSSEINSISMTDLNGNALPLSTIITDSGAELGSTGYVTGSTVPEPLTVYLVGAGCVLGSWLKRSRVRLGSRA
jgi:hypothetical protein